jgi:hypothetical protein
LLGIELLAMALHHAVVRGFPSTVVVGLVNILSVGAATYYWSAACQAKARSITIRATRSASCFSTVMLFPLTCLAVWVFYDFSWFLRPGGGPYNGVAIFVGLTLVPFVIAVAAAVFLALVAVGLYAAAGGWAIERVMRLAVWLRITLTLVVVDCLKTVLLFAVLRYVLRVEELKFAEFAAPGALCTLGWGLALAINQRTKDVLGPSAAV